jgi:hypothetical protein
MDDLGKIPVIPLKMQEVFDENHPVTFEEAVHSFNLPMAGINMPRQTSNTSPQKPGKSRVGRHKEYSHITRVEVSGFEGRGVTRSSLKELITGIAQLYNV